MLFKPLIINNLSVRVLNMLELYKKYIDIYLYNWYNYSYREVNMASIPFSEARAHLTDIVNEVAYGGERMILTRKGKQLVAIIPLEDLKALEALENKIDLEDAKKALADVKKHGATSWEEIKHELGL